ncbi:ACP S-malonyltransferase [Eggerthia catenaformis]|uniref:ACP S-malonyltransferase n=1 Tax=Eggerthia catenaformis TaxID=31973 RepID=UPI00248D7C01|nr:ACP S-malonyltransferase [Eggerthia catenaformis]
MKIGFIYAGQGSQHQGMGQDFYLNNKFCHDFLDQLSSSDFNFKKIMFEKNDLLNQTAYTQPCMGAAAVMTTHMLNEYNIYPDYVCGLSLGEYSALFASGVFDSDTLINTLKLRGWAMKTAAKNIDCEMQAILGLDRSLLEEAVDEAASLGVVSITNYNCPGQLVISGERQAVKKAAELALEKGARKTVKLATSGPFHTKLLLPASQVLHNYFKTITFKPMRVPVVFNTLGKEKENESIPELLEKQVMSPVYFEDSIRYMIDQGVDTFIEIGPGKVLSGFVKKINRNVKILQAEDMKSLEKCKEEIYGSDK